METLEMSKSERRRLEVLCQVRSRKLTLQKGSELLGIGYRQMKRVWGRYQAEGDAGLVHRLRGRKSNRQGDARLRKRVLARYVKQYGDYGPTLAAECLAEEGLVVPVQTLRRWLLAEGLWSRQRQRKQHRRRRARREHFGELAQMDGSHHDWFEGRRAWAVLMVLIDDATGRIYAQFFEEETLTAALTTFRDYSLKYGLPQAIYVDRAGIYRSDREPTSEEILAEKEPQTQFGRAMETLQVRLILAGSPQAKGRVERMNSTLQDRLVKALRQRGISDLGAANKYLEEEFLEPFNGKFGKAPARAADLHRVVTEELDLPREIGVANGAGVSVVRAKREIDFGWFFIGRKRRENYDDWWRCEIRFDPILDEAFGITHTKQQIRPQEYLLEAISPDIENMAKALNARVRQSHMDLQARDRVANVERLASERDHLLKPLPPPKAQNTQLAVFDRLAKRHPALKEAKAVNGSIQYRIVEDKMPDTSFYSFVAKDGQFVLGFVSKLIFCRINDLWHVTVFQSLWPRKAYHGEIAFDG